MKIKLILLILLTGFHSVSIAEDCGGLSNHYGPYDYRTHKSRLPIVEKNHFTNVTYSIAVFGGSNDEYSRKFKFSGQNANKVKGTSIAGDLDYTLRAFPNHPRALYAVSEFQRIKRRKQKNPELWRSGYRTADCYFKRAVKFAPTDSMVYMVYGMHFHKRNKYEKALEQYTKSEKLNKDNIDLLYYIGLLYFDMGDIKNAQKYADIVYSRKYPLLGLQNKLRNSKGK